MYTPRLSAPLWRLDANRKWRLISRFMRPGGRVLEVGSGPGTVVERLRRAGFDVVPLDIRDTAMLPTSRPLLYDGERMPFLDGAFDYALVLTVLHHSHNPAQVLSEAGRVSRTVIVMEDVYLNPWQRRLTQWADSVTNWEFVDHPHNNRTEQQWRNTFAEVGLKVAHAASQPFLGLFRQSIFVLNGSGAVA